MKTVVYQSYRTHDVPAWIERCMETVRGWAEQAGYDYQFIDDRLFDYVPEWYLAKTNRNMCLVSDLARLEVARELLDKGYDRTVWVDADVVVFDPESFTVDVIANFAFCREVWVARNSAGRAISLEAVNNAVAVFVRGNAFLDYYREVCQTIVRHQPVSKLEVGTRFLTRYYALCEFDLITNVGLLSPLVMHGIATGGEPYVRQYIRDFGHRIAAANLCSSLRNQVYEGLLMDDGVYEQVIENLVASKGDIINRYLNE